MNILTNVKNTNTATHVQQNTARNSKSQQRDVVLAAISCTAVPAIHPHIEEAFSLLEI